MKDREEVERLDTIAAQLMERYDAVQILVTWSEDGDTFSLYRGRGNVFARQRMAEEYAQADCSQDDEIIFEPDEWDDEDDDDEEEDEIPH
jgi:hypothetical protein